MDAANTKTGLSMVAFLAGIIAFLEIYLRYRPVRKRGDTVTRLDSSLLPPELRRFQAESMAHQQLSEASWQAQQRNANPAELAELDRQIEASWGELQKQTETLSSKFSGETKDPELRRLEGRQKALRAQQSALLDKLEQLATVEKDLSPSESPSAIQIMEKMGTLSSESSKISAQILDRSKQITKSKIRRLKIVSFIISIIVLRGFIFIEYLRYANK